jgi:PAS domain S-box-containing protein
MSAPNVLVVEDERIVSLDLQERLAGLGYQLAGVADTGEEALALVADRRPDLVLMDIGLRGGVDGIEAADAIGRKFQTPVVLMTASSEEATFDRAKRVRPYGYLLKPFADRELRVTIELAMARSEAEAARQQAEAALRESEARFRALFDDNPDGVLVVDAGTRRVRFGNREICRLLGRSPADLTQLGLEDIHPWESMPRIAEHFGKLALEETHLAPDIPVLRPDGSVVPVDIHASRVLIDGSPCLMGLFRDITERKRAEAQARRQDTRLRLALEAAGMVTWDWDVRAGTIRYSENLASLTGSPDVSPYLTVQAMLEQVHPEDIDRLNAALRQTIEGGLAFECDYRVRLPDGSWRWFLGKGDCVAMENGRAVQVMGVSVDIDERKRTDLVLEAREEVFSTIVGQAFDAIVMVEDATGRFIEFNTAAHEGLGYSREEFGHLTIGDIQAEHSPEVIRRNIALIRQHGGLAFESRHRRRDGEIRDVRVSARPLRLQGRDYMAAVWSDITERKQAEAALRASEEKYRGIFDESVAAIYVFDCAKRFLDTNQAGIDLLGYSREELLRLSIPDVDADPVLVLPAHEQLLTGGRLVNYEHRLRRKDGRVITVLNNSRPLTDASGRVCGMQSTLFDISTRKEVESALRTERLRLDSIIQGAHVGTWEWNVQTGETVFNERWADIVGCTLAEIEPVSIATWVRLAHPDDLQTSNLLLERHFRGETDYYDCEARMRHKDGRWVWVLDRGRVTSRTPEGKPLWMQGVHTDITERKRREAYRAMAHEILVILSAPEDLRAAMGRVLNLVKATTEVDAVGLRLQDGEDYPYFFSEGFSPEFVRRENSLIERTREGGLCRNPDGSVRLECTCGLVISGKTLPGNPLFTPGGSAWTNDSFPFLELPADQDPRLHPRNECIHQGFASVALIPVRAKGGIIGLLQLNHRARNRFTREGIESLEDAARNIGEALLRKRSEVELRESQEQLRHLIAAAQDAIIMVDPAGRICLWNEAAVRVFGYSASEAMGQDLHRLLAPARFQDAAQLGFPGFRDLGTGVAVGRVLEMAGRRKDGSEFPLELSLASLQLGGSWHAVGILRDITDRKQAEETLRERNEDLVRFVYTVSHDLKSPLVTIQTFLGFLEKDLEKADPERVKTDIGYIQRAAAKMLELLEELLELSRIGRKMNPPEDVPFAELVRGGIEAVAGAIAERGVAVQVADVPLVLHGDRRRLTEVFQNLIDNAVKFMGDQADPRVRIGVDEAGAEPVFFVRDNGMGIDPRHHSKLFGLFEKLHPGTPGTGMGLALVKRIVEVHGGRIWAESAGPGQGATFHFTLKGTHRV